MREHALVIGELCGVLVVSDRRAGHAVAIEDGAPAAFVALTTIDEIYPKDREG